MKLPIPTKKICKICQIELPIDRFASWYGRGKYAERLYTHHQCKACQWQKQSVRIKAVRAEKRAIREEELRLKREAKAQIELEIRERGKLDKEIRAQEKLERDNRRAARNERKALDIGRVRSKPKPLDILPLPRKKPVGREASSVRGDNCPVLVRCRRCFKYTAKGVGCEGAKCPESLR